MAKLACVHEASEPEAIHVVFLHGLGGDARFTWMHNPQDLATLWPSWIGEEVGCHVWIAGYGADISGWTDSAMHLADQGEAFFAALQAEPSFQGRRLVLVGHSLGGLVIKSGMTQAESLRDPRLLALLDTVVGVVFVGTPHQGASLATFADRLRIALRTNPQVTNMTSDDAWLKLLNGQFRALHAQRNFSVRVFFETKGVLVGRKIFGLAIGRRVLIVDRNSSDPGITGVVPTGIDVDHIQIAKPKSRQDLIHKALVDFLKALQYPPSATLPSDSDASTESQEPDELPTHLRNASAPLLSWPSTLPDGTWLPRPELEVLNDNLAHEATSTHFLLGDPGCGKSSLLVRLAQEKQAAGWDVLAIKADRLPSDLLDREALAKHLNLGSDTATVLRALAKRNSVLLVIDQADALADLVVQQSARLRVLLDLVQDLSDVSGVHTVISCRTFEQKHDPALRNLTATVVMLELPEWSTVLPVLTARGLQAQAWNQDIQQVLRSPHALDIFFSLLEGATEPKALKSFQGLLEKQWEMQVLSDVTGRRGATLRHLAKLMADREVLGLPLAVVEDHYAEIQALAAAGLLRVDQGPGRVEFRHQTLYEFVRARSFLGDSGSLTETVCEQQSSLRIRPQLWHALGYFRGASPEEYAIEINRLWDANLRSHLKMLLIEFLGLQVAPMHAERRLVQQSMVDQWFLPRFIGAAVGSPGWFAVLSSTHLPRLMSQPEEQAQILLPLLRQALHFSADAVVDLVRQNWLPNEAYDMLSWQVLGAGDVAPKAGHWLDSLVSIAGRTSIGEWAIGHQAGVVSAALPDEAPRLVAAWLKRQIDTARAPLANPSEDDAAVAARVSESIQSVLEARQFHDMEAIAEAAPRAFILSIWPLLNEGLQLCASEAPAVVIGYRQSGGVLFQDLSEEESRYERPLLRSVQLGIQGWAESDAASYIDFAAAHAGSDLLFVHRLLAVGLARAVSHSPLRILDYLLADPRRLVLGPYTDVHRESITLIEAVSPLLDEPSLARLAESLRDWRYYNGTAKLDDAGVRRQKLQWTRQHRLRLLRALPLERLSPAFQRHIEEEERAFPVLADRDVQFSGVQWVGSPVSAEQMERGSDADVLNVFNELTDESAWDHPRHLMKGGAIQAGRELASLARRDLSKVLRIVRALDPVRNEIPVACTLRELVPAGLATPALYSLVAELENKGFVGIDFRRDAAYAIASAANSESPVPVELIDRMERWLTPCAKESSSETDVDERGDMSSILWGLGLAVGVPDGNYPTLSALTASCLASEPRRIDRWLDILEKHIERAESPRVWDVMLNRELLNLRMADCARAESLVDKLIARERSIGDGVGWAHFVAASYLWASAAAVRRWLESVKDKPGKGLQSLGELVGLRHALFPAEDWSRELVQLLIDGCSSEPTLGLAYSVANLWHEPMTRPVVHPLLLQLLRSRDEQVLTALSGVFVNGGFTTDAETQELLDALVACPRVMENGRAEFLPEMLSKIVASEPERVCQVAHALLNIAGDQMGNVATSWYLSTEWLLDIALQLQDMGAAERAAGSGLFERMLEFNMPQAREMTLDLDKRTPAGDRLRAPVRRSSRRRQRKPGQLLS